MTPARVVISLNLSWLPCAIVCNVQLLRSTLLTLYLKVIEVKFILLPPPPCAIVMSAT